MSIKFSTLTLQQQKLIEEQWKSGVSAREIEREYDMLEGAIRKVAYNKGWRKDSDKWEQDLEVERLKSQLNIANRKYNQAVKETSAVNRLVDTMRDTIKAAPAVKPLQIERRLKTGSDHHAVALVSDVHVGEVVSSSETNNLGAYNTAIFEERLERWTTNLLRLIELRRERLNVPSLSLFFLGDIVSGEIHDELANTNDSNIVEQTILAAQGFSESILALAPHFDEIEISGVVGNHGRMARKPYYKQKQIKNFDYLIYKMMELTLGKQDNIKFHIPDSFWTIRDVMGTRFLLVHGDGNMSWSGVPYYGIERSYLKLHELIGRDVAFDRVVMGHFHEIIITNRYIINGSFKGADEYSIGKLYRGGLPEQILMYVHPEHGIVGYETVILEDVDNRRIVVDGV